MNSLQWTFRLLRYAAGQAEPQEARAVYREVQSSEVLREQLFAMQRVGEDFDTAWERLVPVAKDQPARTRIDIRGAIDAARRVAVAALGEFGGTAKLQLVGQADAGPSGHAEVREGEARLRAAIEQRADLSEGLERMEALTSCVPGLQHEIVWDIDWDGAHIGEIRMFPVDSRAMVRVEAPGSWAAVLHTSGGREWLDLEEVDGIEGTIAEFALPDGPFEVSLLSV